ncbi:multidrug transporter [beta proteobacterium AAP121]|nr:multidrug transporter [beta proteobacterium AAP65]KPF96640.1 multidrug transporter [beta proteobacterium AAP121]
MSRRWNPVSQRPQVLLPLLSSMLLAACSFAPVHQRPAAPVAEAFPQAGAGTGTPAAELAWQDFFADARLKALVDLALLNNRDLRIAVLNVEQARAQLGVQRADQLPTVNAGVSGSRAPTGNSYSLGLQITAFELDLFGRVKNLSEAAVARYLATDEGRRAAQASLVAAVASADLALRADDELLALTQRTLASREEGLRLVKLRFDGGVAAEPELRSAESLVAAARVGLAALQRQRSQDSNALALLLGQPLPADLPAAAPLQQLRLAELPVGLPSEVLLQRPDVRQAEQQLVAANANIGAARAAFFPRISLTGSAGFASNQLSGLFDNTAWTFAPQLLQPLFDSGRNSANLAVAQAARDIAVASYEKTVQTAFREVADALAGRATLGEQLAAQQAQADAEARRLALAEQLFSGGVANALERLDAERSALAARQAVVQLQLARLQNAVQLYRVLGGGAPPPAAG